jgi:hypothetical protein
MKIKALIVAIMTLVLAAGALEASAESKKKAAKQENTVTDVPQPGACSDPAATMLLSSNLEAGIAAITMKGTICNIGQADYNGNDPLDAHFMVYTWHTPKTPAQEHDLKTISHIKMSKKLKKGECRDFTQIYKIKGVAKLGHSAENQTERPASKQFVFRVEKKYPMQAGDIDFSKTEDCNMSNNAARQTIDYMEKK